MADIYIVEYHDEDDGLTLVPCTTRELAVKVAYEWAQERVEDQKSSMYCDCEWLEEIVDPEEYVKIVNEIESSWSKSIRIVFDKHQIAG